MQRRSLLAAVLLAGCHATDVPPPEGAPPPPATATATPTATAAPAPPAGGPPASWWRATPLQGYERSSLALKVTADEIVFVNQREDVIIRPGKLERSEDRAWNWSLGSTKCTLALEAASPRATLRCNDGRRDEAFSLEPTTDGARFDGLLAAKRPPKDICPKAEACCIAAHAVLEPGGKCDLDYELGNPRIPHHCVKTIEGLRLLLADAKKPVPKACE